VTNMECSFFTRYHNSMESFWNVNLNSASSNPKRSIWYDTHDKTKTDIAVRTWEATETND